MRPLYLFGLIVAVLFLLAIARLDSVDSGDPAHQFVELHGQEPATLYLPGDSNAFYHVFPPPNRPPAVVLIHGFMGDRQLMSTMARRIARNGYAVLAIDVSGHGANRNPFPGDFPNFDALRPDVKKAVDFLRNYHLVDGSRIVVMGHSMGAAAALDYATIDPDLKGAVMVSGGFGLNGSERPKNALFIFGSRDPDFIKLGSNEIAAHLANVPQVTLGKLYGDFAQGNAVEVVQVPGADHLQMVYSTDAAGTIVKWLDSTFGTVRAGEPNLTDARRSIALAAALLFLLLLVPLGMITGEIAGKWDYEPAGLGGWWGLAILAGALLAAMPLVATIVPAAFFPMVVGDAQVSWFMAAGVILLMVLVVAHVFEWRRLRDRLGITIFAALMAMTVVYLCRIAAGIPLHSFALTPERLICALLGAVLLFPFWLCFEFMLRRGSVLVATIRASIGRLLIVALMLAGIFLQVLPMVLLLILQSLVLLYVMVEIFAASAYSSSRNLILIALVESAWFAWVIAAISPITLML